MDDEQLTQLAIEAQQHPPNSKARQTALTRLISGLLSSKRLIYPSAPGLSADRYRDYRAEALQNLFYYICQFIDRYDSDRASVVRWVNMLLDRRFFREVSQQETQQNQRFFAKSFDDAQISLREMQRILELERPFLSERIYRCIEEDIDDIFKTDAVHKQPQANFQAIALRRLDGYSWQHISQELGVKMSTLCGFYQRALKKNAPILLDSIQNLEY